MDLGQIKQAFAFSEGIIERMRTWQSTRVTKIGQGSGFVFMGRHPCFVLHALPIQSFSGAQFLSATELRSAVPRVIWTDNNRVNAEGILFWKRNSLSNAHVSYLQVYRSGQIEIAVADLADVKDLIHARFESVIIKLMGGALTTLQSLGVPPPIGMFLSGVNMANARINPRFACEGETSLIERERVFFGDIWVEDYEADLALPMKSLFDSVWNASGVERSPFILNDGRRRQGAPE